MTTEERLANALAAAKDYEASPDLWTRVVYSIEEERDHRRRLIATATGIVLVATVALVAIGVNIERLAGRTRIDWRALEAIELMVLVALVVSLGPAIRRFGRGFISDLFVTSPDAGTRLLSLLDVAYFLVFSGYILVTTRLAAPIAHLAADIGDQVEDAAWRVGGLLLTMGLLHAVTLVTLPVVALVFNSTRAGRKLPRWLVVVLVAVGVLIGMQVLSTMVGLVAAGG